MKITPDNLAVFARAQGCRLKPGHGHVTVIRSTAGGGVTVDVWEDGKLFLRTTGADQPLTIDEAAELLGVHTVSS